METKKNRIGFYNPCIREEQVDAAFGCATLGFTSENGWTRPEEEKNALFPFEVEGIVISGGMRDVAEEAARVPADIKVKGGVVFVGNCGGEEAFVEALHARFPGVPFVGGSPAIGADGRIGRMLPRNGEASLLLITDKDYSVSVKYGGVHHEVVEKLTVLGTAARKIEAVRTEEGEKVPFYDYIHALAERKGVEEGVHERIAISDLRGKNIHLIPDGKRFLCGADLPESREVLVRYTDIEHAYQTMKAFYATPDSIIFGCAGLKSLLGERTFPAGENSVGLFLFGEVVSINGKPSFANLTLQKMTLLPVEEGQ